MGMKNKMTDFRIKTLRCEWQVVNQGVDQYGMSTKDRVVLSSWGTSEEAYADLPNHGAPSVWVKERWLPFDSISGYQILEVQYREVEI
jgi:hypothetical protein